MFTIKINKQMIYLILSDGLAVKTFTLPDSITTWSFTAIGVGQEGGACVSSPLNMRVFKPTFTQVRLPYRAVRLEEVVIHVGIYNYLRFPINVSAIKCSYDVSIVNAFWKFPPLLRKCCIFVLNYFYFISAIATQK